MFYWLKPRKCVVCRRHNRETKHQTPEKQYNGNTYGANQLKKSLMEISIFSYDSSRASKRKYTKRYSNKRRRSEKETNRDEREAHFDEENVDQLSINGNDVNCEWKFGKTKVEDKLTYINECFNVSLHYLPYVGATKNLAKQQKFDVHLHLQ